MRQAETTSLRRVWALLLLGLTVALGGCAVQLAPPYDPQIEEQLVSLDARTQQFFEELLAGDAEQAGYDANRDFYVELLAGLESTRVLALARPQPSGPLADLGGRAFKSIAELDSEEQAAAAKGLPNISAEVLERMILNVRDMQTDHQAAGRFTAGDVATYRPLLTQNFTDLLRYERYLKRG